MTRSVALPAELHGSAVEAEVEPTLSPEEQRLREERKSGIGGTDVAAIAGLHPYKGAWEVWAERKGIIPEFEGNERTEIGQALEEPIARIYSKREGVLLRRVGECWREKERPFFLGHPDRVLVGRKKGLEIKTYDGRQADRWSAPGEPMRIPEEYYCQVQWYMGLRGYDLWDLAVMMGLRRVQIYTVERNETVISALKERGVEFWQRYILGSEEPPMDASGRALAYLKAKHPKEMDGVMVEDSRVDTWAQQYKDAATRESTAKDDKEEFGAHLKGLIGDHLGASGTVWDVTWKKIADTYAMVTDYEALLRFYAEKHGFTVAADDIAKFTQNLITRAGGRRINAKLKTRR